MRRRVCLSPACSETLRRHSLGSRGASLLVLPLGGALRCAVQFAQRVASLEAEIIPRAVAARAATAVPALIDTLSTQVRKEKAREALPSHPLPLGPPLSPCSSTSTPSRG